jgi:hypothetical protein
MIPTIDDEMNRERYINQEKCEFDEETKKKET